MCSRNWPPTRVLRAPPRSRLEGEAPRAVRGVPGTSGFGGVCREFLPPERACPAAQNDRKGFWRPEALARGVAAGLPGLMGTRLHPPRWPCSPSVHPCSLPARKAPSDQVRLTSYNSSPLTTSANTPRPSEAASHGPRLRSGTHLSGRHSPTLYTQEPIRRPTSKYVSKQRVFQVPLVGEAVAQTPGGAAPAWRLALAPRSAPLRACAEPPSLARRRPRRLQAWVAPRPQARLGQQGATVPSTPLLWTACPLRPPGTAL